MLKKHFSFLRFCTGGVAVLFIVYVGLVAVVMSYASLTIEYSQSIKNDGASVAVLESKYLASVAQINAANFPASEYTAPLSKRYVPAQSVTAVR